MTDSSKISRRDLIKTLTAAGAALAAVPLLAGAATAAGVEPASVSVNENKLEAPAGTQLAPRADEPLVLVVGNSEIHAYKGMKELRVTDSALSSKLHSTFQRVLL